MDPIAKDALELALELLTKLGCQGLPDFYLSLPGDQQLRITRLCFDQHGRSWAGCWPHEQVLPEQVGLAGSRAYARLPLCVLLRL